MEHCKLCTMSVDGVPSLSMRDETQSCANTNLHFHRLLTNNLSQNSPDYIRDGSNPVINRGKIHPVHLRRSNRLHCKFSYVSFSFFLNPMFSEDSAAIFCSSSSPMAANSSEQKIWGKGLRRCRSITCRHTLSTKVFNAT